MAKSTQKIFFLSMSLFDIMSDIILLRLTIDYEFFHRIYRWMNVRENNAKCWFVNYMLQLWTTFFLHLITVVFNSRNIHWHRCIGRSGHIKCTCPNFAYAISFNSKCRGKKEKSLSLWNSSSSRVCTADYHSEIVNSSSSYHLNFYLAQW